MRIDSRFWICHRDPKYSSTILGVSRGVPAIVPSHHGLDDTLYCHAAIRLVDKIDNWIIGEWVNKRILVETSVEQAEAAVSSLLTTSLNM